MCDESNMEMDKVPSDKVLDFKVIEQPLTDLPPILKFSPVRFADHKGDLVHAE